MHARPEGRKGWSSAARAVSSRSLSLTCVSHAPHVSHMSKMIQLRNVPEALHTKLRVRAALAGMSLSDYLQGELARSAEQLTVAELRLQLDALEPVRVSESAADILRRERDRQ